MLDNLESALNGRVQTWKRTKERAKDNTLIFLANMYDTYKKVVAGKKPRINPEDVELFGHQIKQFEQSEQTLSLRFEHPLIVTEMNKAYNGLREYVKGDSKYKRKVA